MRNHSIQPEELLACFTVFELLPNHAKQALKDSQWYKSLYDSPCEEEISSRPHRGRRVRRGEQVVGRTRRQQRESEQGLGRSSRNQLRERESERVADGRKPQQEERERDGEERERRGELGKVIS